MIEQKTMQMMMSQYTALKEVGLDIYQPQDYLNFFYLVNCEVVDSPSTTISGVNSLLFSFQVSANYDVCNLQFRFVPVGLNCFSFQSK